MAIIVADVNMTTKSIVLLYSTTVSVQNKSLQKMHDAVLQELIFLYNFYAIEMTTVENQQKGTSGRVYDHNLLNSNVQALVYAVGKLKSVVTVAVEPKKWHSLLNGKSKNLKVYRSLELPFAIDKRRYLRTIHEFDALFILVSQLIQ